MADMQTVTPAIMTSPEAVYGVVGEFVSSDDLMAAVSKLRHAGFADLEAFTPFPIHGIDEAIGEPRSPLGYIVFCGGATGFTFGTTLQWWTGAHDYLLSIGGKPLFDFPPSVPIMFEATVLFSAFTAIFGMLALNGLPRLYHSIFNYSNFPAVTDDAFVLAIKKTDPKFDIDALRTLLESAGARKIEVIEE